MIDVPDEKTITGLTRSELIAMVYSLKKERDEAEQAVTECGKHMCTTCMTAEHTTPEHETAADVSDIKPFGPMLSDEDVAQIFPPEKP